MTSPGARGPWAFCRSVFRCSRRHRCFAYFLYPPEIKRGDEVARWAGGELITMGRITRSEATMALLAVAALVGWIGGGRWISPVTVALAVISLMLLARVVSWNDIPCQ